MTRPSGSTHGVLSWSLLLEIMRTLLPSSSQLYSVATRVYQQFTNRRQRLEQNIMPPSGR
jgi:hypothetical protein